MYLTDEILEKLNSGKQKANGLTSAVTLPDIMVRSFAQVKELAGDSLSWGEKNFLYQQAQKALKENKMAESRILSRANPQLANAVRLGIRPSPMQGNYSLPFPDRATTFVKPGDVSSMFSPAGYLTELYREARELHPSTSQYHLDTRRPDLASLSLSQDNMDDELSTLSLSNELLLNNIEGKEGKNYDGVMEMLSTYRQTGATPFHWPYEATRQAIMLQDPGFDAFRNNPAVAAKMDTASLLGIAADISPELREILTEEITDDNADDLIKKNFGDIKVEVFQSPTYLARYYSLSDDELTSLLGMVSAGSDINPGVQYYKNDSLVSLISDDNGVLSAVIIQRTAGHNAYQFGYSELVPTGVGTYFFDFSIVYAPSAGLMQVGTEGIGSKDIYSRDNYNVQSGVPIQLPVSLTAEQAGKTVTISVTRKGGAYYANVDFDIKSYPFSVLLLKLNKLIRLYKATGISPSDIRTVLESDNNDLTITDATLSQLFWVRYYMQTYGIDVDAALVLAGANISQISHGSEASAFTRLFNTPPLNNQPFSADGTALSLEPGASGDTFRIGVLKRALQVNDTELSTLWALTGTSFTTTIDKLSALYRTGLLASVHGLSVTELNLLLSVSPYADKKLDTLTGAELSALISFIAQYRQWLKDQNWTVSDLYLMLTSRFSTTLTPDIENLITTLKNGLASQNLSKATEAELITAAAPFIAAATQLDSAGTAEAILQWLDQLKPQELTFKDFLLLADNDSRKDVQTTNLVTYCQVMGQLALIARSTGLSATELSWMVAHPVIMAEKAPVLGHDVTTLRDMVALHSLLARCGAAATEILTSLSGIASEKDSLAVSTVATALTLDEQALTQALSQVSAYDYFYCWVHLRDALQWLDVAATFNITPADVAKLVALNYTDPGKLPAYADWVAVSHALQGGLNAQQTAQLQAKLDEATSSAVSAYVIKNGSPSWVTSRDELYSWLLIDNQVSAQIKTTRIAEAIASVQLYVNRALASQEEGVDNAVKAAKFFAADWETYNKRYSTWAGVSELVYYPENYVDPTLRIGQTSMMNEMLQTLSQSQLTSDTVEDAFKTYMTRFEEIANLDVISGYHDNVSDQSGTTYLVGRSAIGDYYWRSADIDKMSEGKLPANAWSEWKKITAAITPVSNLIRPVIFQSRLYLVWVESKEVSEVNGSTTKKVTEYSMKYAHILHDGTWSVSVSIPAANVQPPSNSITSKTAIYCSAGVESGELYVLYYEKQDSYQARPAALTGMSLSPDGNVKNISTDKAVDIANDVYTQLDTTSHVMLNSPYVNSKKIVFDGYSTIDRKPGELGFTSITEIMALNTDIKDDGSFSFNLQVKTSYTSTDDRWKNTIGIIKSAPDISIGDTIWVPAKREIVRGSLYKNAEMIMINNGSSFTDYVLAFDANPIIKNLAWGDTYNSMDSVGNGGLKKYTHNTQPIDNNVTEVVYGEFLLANIDKVHFDDFFAVDTGNPLKFSHFSLPYNSINLIGPTDIKTEKYTFDESVFKYTEFSAALEDKAFNDNKLSLELVVELFTPTDSLGFKKSLGRACVNFVFYKISTLPAIVLSRTDTYAQYLQYSAHRVRVNTLFAKQLVALANAGLSTILSKNTQNIQEPKLGKGTYVTLVFSRYDKNIHGSSKQFEITMCDVFAEGDHFTLANGTLNDAEQTTCTFFLPRLDESTASPQDMYFCANYQSGYTSKIQITPSDSDDGWKLGTPATFPGLDNVYIPDRETEPMDFSGANAIYFWEMFYYVPMMVFKRLLSESKFEEATRWLHYIWNPAGYLVDGQIQDYYWNVRPLEEETSWHANPLDSVDPDAVAQSDPLHYKVATFMSYLDLLIARGDLAYRQLERDTLNEAKMWYVQALDILGDEPYLAQGTGWASPRLTDAADKTTRKAVQQALLTVQQQLQDSELHTANSLTSLFLPQQNEKLAGYWQTLSQRLYNLRHNLSIDGQPLSLSIYAAPADPSALLSAAVSAASGGSDLPVIDGTPLYRFPVMLESARGLVGQLTQFGSTLLSLTERQDAEALSELLQTQGSALVLQSVALQDKDIAALDADRAALEESRRGAQSRLDSYTTLYDEDVNIGEKQAMDLFLSSSVIADGGQVFHTTAGALDLAPNIFGLADGGSRWGAAFTALGSIADLSASATRTAGERISQSEAYRRRRQEWEIQRNSAQSDVKQINAQLASLAVRREAAVLQKTYLETQQSQTQAQMAFLQNKFSNKALYNWLRGKLAAIYYQFYDLAVSRCLMAQEAYKWSLGTKTATFIRPGAWQGTYAGLMAGETLTLNLAQMEQEYLKKDEREKEVTRTVCLSEFYAGLSSDDAFVLADKLAQVVTDPTQTAGTGDNSLKMVDKKLLQATLKLSDLKISDDYPATLGLGNTRRIKQISVTLPALVGPYQDVRAALSYGGSVVLPQGCNALAVSHGMNDSGQFQLDFSDSRWLPFEGIPVDDSGILTLSFPQADGSQKDLLLSLTDIIVHIRYTIAS